jgi:hypothetical protein
MEAMIHLCRSSLGAPGGVVNVESRFGKERSKADRGF